MKFFSIKSYCQVHDADNVLRATKTFPLHYTNPTKGKALGENFHSQHEILCDAQCLVPSADVYLALKLQKKTFHIVNLLKCSATVAVKSIQVKILFIRHEKEREKGKKKEIIKSM